MYVSVIDHKIMKIGECCPIYGGPEPMHTASTKGENLLGMLGLELLHLDIDSSSKTLVPTRPSKKRYVHRAERYAKRKFFSINNKSKFWLGN